MSMRRPWKWLVLCIVSATSSAWAQSLVQQWAVQPTGPTGEPTQYNCAGPVHKAALDPAGDVVRVGWVYVAHGTPPAPSTVALYAAKYASATGAEVWRFQRTETAAQGTSCLRAVAVNAAGDVIVGGVFRDATMPRQYVAKLSGADGSVIWEQLGEPTEDASTASSDVIDLALDASGNVLVIGQQNENNQSWYSIVSKFDGASGARLWHQELTGDTDSQLPVGIAVDPSGDVVAATYVHLGSEIFKLSGSDGSRIWTTPWSWTLPIPGLPELEGIVLDPLGKVVIFGKAVAKFAADGSFDWQSPLDASDSSSHVYAATFAQNGDVLATGATRSETQVTTARFASASGALVWSANFDSPDKTHGRQGGHSVKKDVNGDVMIAGGIIRDFANMGVEALTAKYDGATGALKGYAVYPDDAGPGKGPGLVVLLDTQAVYTDGAAFLVRYSEWPLKSAGTMPRKMDFNLDGRADLAWRDSAGHYHLWNMLGLFPAAQGPDVGAEPDILATGDLDGDGRTDFIFRNPDDRYDLWQLSGDTVETNYQSWLGPGTLWTVVGTGRFDADNVSDMLMHEANGLYMIMMMDPASFGFPKASTGNVTPPGPNFEVVQIGDFDGDGKDDLLWRHPDGRVVIMLMDGTAAKASAQVLAAGSGWTPVLLGDFNGDGKADIVWRHFNGSYGIWLVNGTSIASYAVLLGPHTGWTATMVGDLDGDGKHDLIWSHANGSQGAWLMDGASIKQYGSFSGVGAWKIVRTDDFDADGKADLLWRNTQTNQYGMWLMDGLNYKSFGALPEPLDWKAEP